MERVEPACPHCGSVDTQLAEIAWASRKLPAAAPPVPRRAETNAGRFYAFHSIGLTMWALIGVYVGTLIKSRSEAVIETALVAGIALFLHLSWLLGHSPRPTPDQIEAWDEWYLAQAEWQRSWLCLTCGKTFMPADDGH